MRDTLMDGVSLVAVDAETDEMLGFRTAKVCCRWECMTDLKFSTGLSKKVSAVSCRDDQQEPRRPTVEELRQGFPEAFADISVVLDLLLWPPEFFLDFPHLHRCYYMFTLATKPECRGRGIARELLKQAFKVSMFLTITGGPTSSHPDRRLLRWHEKSVVTMRPCQLPIPSRIRSSAKWA